MLRKEVFGNPDMSSNRRQEDKVDSGLATNRKWFEYCHGLHTRKKSNAKKVHGNIYPSYTEASRSSSVTDEVISGHLIIVTLHCIQERGAMLRTEVHGNSNPSSSLRRVH